MGFSIVMPIHNEEKNLPYSLPRILDLEPDEIIIILDRCNDKSKNVIQTIIKKNGYVKRIKLLVRNDQTPDWKYRVAYLFREGFKATENDSILTMAADIVLDPKIKLSFSELNKNNVKLISFGLKYHPMDIQYFLKRLVSFLFPSKGFSGVFLFSKKAWLETENQNEVKKILKSQDTFLSNSIKRKYQTRHIWSNTMHMRTRTTDSKDQFMRGVAYYQITNKSLFSVFLSSILYLRPMTLKGYLMAREKHLKSSIYSR